MPLASLGENLSTRLGKREKAVKECLLNQSVITGNGNIYSDKILFATHIHPERPANTLAAEEWNRLASVIPEQLAFVVEKDETTPKSIWRQKVRTTVTHYYYRSMATAKSPARSVGRRSAAL